MRGCQKRGVRGAHPVHDAHEAVRRGDEEPRPDLPRAAQVGFVKLQVESREEGEVLVSLGSA